MALNKEAHRVDITSGTIFRFVLVLIGFWFLYLIADLLLMLFASVVIASAIKPLADKLQSYKVPRAVSVLFVYVLVLALLSGVVTLMIPPLSEQLTQMAHALPQLAEYLNLSSVLPSGDVQGAVSPIQQALVGVGDNLANVSANIFRQTKTVFSGIFMLIFVFVIALYLVVDKEAMIKPFRLVLPQKHLPYVEMVIKRAQKKIGRWVVAQLSLAVIIGVVVSIGLWTMGVPYSLLLGLLAGVLEVIPIIGPILAAVPAVLVGFSQSVVLGVGLMVFYLVVQQAENHLLIPAMMRKATGLNPLVTILAVLLGARLIGIVGVMLAVPAAAVLSTFADDFASSEEREANGVEG